MNSIIDKIYKSFEPSKGIVLIIKLWRLSKEIGDRRVNSIIAWISDPRIYEIPMDEGYNYAYKVNASLGRKKNNPIPENPKANFGDKIVKWVNWLSTQDNKTAKRSIELFNLVYDISLVDNWDHWWKQLNTCIRNAEKITRPLTRNNPLNAKLNAVREKIKKIGVNVPPAIKAELLFNLLMKWSDNSVAKDYEKIVKAL
jgi:hypothetical protein